MVPYNRVRRLSENRGKSDARNYHRIYINPVVSDGEAMRQQMTLRDSKSADGIHVEPFRKLASSHIAIYVLKLYFDKIAVNMPLFG